MSFLRWGAAPLVAGVVLLLSASDARAGELDACLSGARGQVLTIADHDLGLAERARPVGDAVVLGDLQPIEDFHPEVDRWTARNNRIRITGWTGLWAFSGELDIDATAVIGFRINWEVPGFIGIRWDSGFVPWAQLEVKDANNDTEKAYGVVHSHTLSIGIFNPELSIGGLSFWAGFGLGLWVYDFNDNDVSFNSGTDVSVSFSETDGILGDEDAINLSGNIFIELDYEVADIFHIGLGLRQHILLADHTNLGRFYEINGTLASRGDGRNSGPLDDLAGVTEITVNFSFLF